MRKMKRLALVLILLQGAVFIFAQSPQAVIREISGTVEMKRPGAANWTTARVGDLIERATAISTGFKSMALLTVGNSTITVRPVTRLSLEELVLQHDTETINLGLQTGRIRVAVNPPAGGRTDFTVRGPTATASVRGTAFTMDPDSIQVNKGSVRYQVPANAGRSFTVQVNAGQATWVDTNTGLAINPLIVSAQSKAPPAMAGESNSGGLIGGDLHTISDNFVIKVNLLPPVP